MLADSFSELLQKLAAKHDSEVNVLRDENARLLAKLALGTGSAEGLLLESPSAFALKENSLLESTLESTASTVADSHKFPPKSAGPRIFGESLQLRCAPYSLTSNGVPGAPDEEALAAAFAVAMDETDELEQVMVDIAQKVEGDEPTELPLSSAICTGFNRDLQAAILPVPLESKPQNHTSPPPTEWWWDPKTSKQSHGGRWPPIGDAEPNLGGNFEVGEESDADEVPCCYADKDLQKIMANRVSQGVKGKEGPQSAMRRWETLINYAQTAQFVQSLPKINDVWLEAAADISGENSPVGLEGLANLRGLVKKEISMAAELKQKQRSNLISRTMQPFMMHPTCRRRVCWDMGGITLLLHDLIFIPFQVFDTGTGGLGDGYADFLRVLDFIGASFWLIDIFVSFLTGFYSAEGFVELTPNRVAKHYVKSWFPMDLLIVSVDWSSMFIGMSSASGYMRLGKTVSRIMRVLRLLRFLKMNRPVRELMERVNSEYLLQMISLLKTLIFIVIINHYIACIWYAVGTSGAFNSNWPDKHLVNYPGTFTYAYTTALHWSLTQFTPASMEVVPQNPVERLFTILVIIMALVAFSSFVSSITAAMTHIRQINARQVAEEAAIRQFFAEHKVSHGTASRIWHFVRKNKGNTGKRMKESDVPALKAIPHKLKEDLRLEVYLPLLGAHAFFDELYVRDKAIVLKLVQAPTLVEKTIPVGEELFRGVDEATKMFFVANGTLQYIENPSDGDLSKEDEELGERVTYVTRGMWAYEAALWADRAVVHGPFHAVSGAAEVILIDAVHFQSIAKVAGDALPFIAKYSQIFMDNFRDACITANEGESQDDIDEETTYTSKSTAMDEMDALTSKTLLFNEAELIIKFTESAKKEAPTREDANRPLGAFMRRLSSVPGL